ncbi:SGNH hydrolase [Tothia fuscella]|uniref:SGNH hydrolase n=1 Tax=Tothia fuscella TaxID=1048955 RepID=A0A9P4NWW0_9PEZI|nr:SGNH hydrolase [Tothia fuscella]
MVLFKRPWILALLVSTSWAAKIYLCGDSTMASNGKNGMDGWGNYLTPFVDLSVVNRARGGRSARSYTREGLFNEVAKLVTAGDWVVIEFGHNDGGSVSPSNDNGRTDCPVKPGAGGEKSTCAVNFEGEKVAKTFPAYLQDAGKMFVAKGAKVIMSSQTPNNVYETKKYVYSPSRFGEFAKDAAKAVGPQAFFVDHGLYTAEAYKQINNASIVTNNLFMKGDHTHTTVEGAKLVAKAFAKAVVCAKIPFAEHVKKVSC